MKQIKREIHTKFLVIVCLTFDFLPSNDVACSGARCKSFIGNHV